MSSKSNDQGRAYEYICLHTLNNAIGRIRNSEIEKIVVMKQLSMHGTHSVVQRKLFIR